MRLRTQLLTGIVVAACAGPATPAAGPTDAPTAEPGRGDGVVTTIPAEPTTRDLPGGDGTAPEARIVLEVGGRSITLPNIALCQVTSDQVEISASAAGGTTGLTVSWFENQPPEQTSIVYVDLGSALTLIAGPEVSAESPPQVQVSGHTAEIFSDVHDPDTERPSQSIRVLADCPKSEPDQPPAPTEPPAAASGRASFDVEGRGYTFEFGELCQVGSGAATVHLTDADDNSFNLIVMGQTGFFTVTIGSGEQWSAGLSGEAVQPTISALRASWSGTALDTYSGREAAARFSVECAQ